MMAAGGGVVENGLVVGEVIPVSKENIRVS
jgi:hypothetical protein